MNKFQPEAHRYRKVWEDHLDDTQEMGQLELETWVNPVEANQA